MTSKPRKMATLCALCLLARDDPPFKNPMPLAHPVTGDAMLFDVRGEAVCSNCGARYRRVLNIITLIEETSGAAARFLMSAQMREYRSTSLHEVR